MAKWVALLRGVNVGGKNKLGMADLRHSLADSGLDSVESYIQSGNLAFQSGLSARQLESLIHDTIQSRFGHDVPALVLSASELRKLLADNPFQQHDGKTLYATLLSRKPAAKQAQALEQQDWSPDQLAIVRRTVYLHCPRGYGDTRLSNAYFEKSFDVVATSRNWRTWNRIADLIR